MTTATAIDPHSLERPVFRNTLYAALISLLFLVGFTNPSLPLDQDEGSKAAKIESLARDHWFASPMRGAQYYREAYFGVYYQSEAFVRKLLPFSSLQVMNYSSPVLGCLCFCALATLLRRLTGLGPWWTLFLFVNTPALVITFLYGNEAAFSITFVCIAAALIAQMRGVLTDSAAGVVFGLAFFCRPDVLFLAPFLAVLLCTDTTDAALRLHLWWKRLFTTGAAALITVVAYWTISIRAFPHELAFPWIIDYRLIASYFLFGFGPIVMLLAAMGAVWRVRSIGVRQLLLPASTLLPLAYYYKDLGSTKYILGFIVGTFLCASWAIRQFPRLARMSLMASAFFWVISITPFGIYGPVRGGHWVIPMGHGPVPFGSYLGFCEAARKGFFQNRYLALLNTWGEIMDRLPSNPKPMSVIGSSDGHMLNLVSQQRRTPVTDQQIAFDFAGEHLREPGRKVMLFNSYSRLSYLNAPGAEALVRAWLSQGLVESLTGEPDMPLAVEVGPEVKNGSRALGQRILFAEEQARDAGLAPALYFTRDYDTFCWVPASSRPAHVLYRDEEFYATTDCGPTARLWGNWWPSVYYQRYADRAKSALTH